MQVERGSARSLSGTAGARVAASARDSRLVGRPASLSASWAAPRLGAGPSPRGQALSFASAGDRGGAAPAVGERPDAARLAALAAAASPAPARAGTAPSTDVAALEVAIEEALREEEGGEGERGERGSGKEEGWSGESWDGSWEEEDDEDGEEVMVVEAVEYLTEEDLRREAFLGSFSGAREEDEAGALGAASAAEDYPRGPLEILHYPDPRLRAANAPVARFGPALRSLVDAMFETMYEAEGIGLAAPQVGVNERLVVINAWGERGQGRELALANPRVVARSADAVPFEEGCLSLPGLYAEVLRPSAVTVRAQCVDTGRQVRVRLAGLEARVFQHELDHLRGLLFADRAERDGLEEMKEGLQELRQDYGREHGGEGGDWKLRRGIRTQEPGGGGQLYA